MALEPSAAHVAEWGRKIFPCHYRNKGDHRTCKPHPINNFSYAWERYYEHLTSSDSYMNRFGNDRVPSGNIGAYRGQNGW